MKKIVLAFYYAWYWTKEYSSCWSMWNYGNKHEPDKIVEGRRDISCPHYPIEGPYDSNDPILIQRHFNIANEAGIDAFIVSWWSRNNILNKPFKALLDYAAKNNTKISIYYETVPSVPFKYKITALDLIDFINEYTYHPGFLKIEGQPVIFFFRRVIRQHSIEQWVEIIKLLKRECKVLLIADARDEELIKLFDGAHVYSTLDAYLWRVNVFKYMQKFISLCKKNNKISCFSVMPGFDDKLAGNKFSLKRRIWQAVIHRKKELVIEREGGKTYCHHWEWALDSNSDWITICSFNEWIEGTEIEPSIEFGRQYIDITKRYIEQFKAGE